MALSLSLPWTYEEMAPGAENKGPRSTTTQTKAPLFDPTPLK